MIDHDYLDLKLGAIEQYTMVVLKKDLPKWRESGWLPFDEIGLPKGDEEAWMLYGDVQHDEILIFNRPQLVRDLPAGALQGLEVQEVCTYLGTYGMGGPGFFGLRLSNGYYLTFAVYHASEYILVQDKVVACDPVLYHRVMPWIASFHDEDRNWDELSPLVIGSKIEGIEFTSTTCTVTLCGQDGLIELVCVKNDPRLPITNSPKDDAFKAGIISDYLVLQLQNARLIV